jgi:hypothetical protein
MIFSFGLTKSSIWQNVNSYEYLMDGISFLPHVKNLWLSFVPRAHAFGATMFHLLRLCAGTRILKLKLIHREVKFVPFLFSMVGTTSTG